MYLRDRIVVMPSSLRNNAFAWLAFAAVPCIGVAKYQVIDRPIAESNQKIKELELERNRRRILNAAPSNNFNMKILDWARTTPGKDWLKRTRLLEEFQIERLDSIQTAEEKKILYDAEDYASNIGFTNAAQQQGLPCLDFKRGLQQLEESFIANSSLAKEHLLSGKTDYQYILLPNLDLTGNIVEQVTKGIEDPVERNVKAARLHEELNNLLRKETMMQGQVQDLSQ